MKFCISAMLALLSGFFGSVSMAPMVFLIAKSCGRDRKLSAPKQEKELTYDTFVKVLHEYHLVDYVWIMYSSFIPLLFTSPFFKPQSTIEFMGEFYIPCPCDFVSLFDGRNPVLAVSALLWGTMSLLEGLGFYTWGLGAQFACLFAHYP